MLACDKAVEDEATVAGLTGEKFPQADEDYFKDMDNGIALTPDEVQGRNMWLVWTGGNDRFWDGMGKPTLGGFDLLKIVAPPPGKDMDRQDRWYTLGLVNEPCFDGAPPDGDPSRFGLRLDMRRADCPPDPFANAQKYPGVKIGARGATYPDGSVLPIGSYFGEPTGILGLRLFTNPDFDEAAKAKWDAKRYYTDPAYFSDPTLIKPYRVGMSCGFCHVGPSPINPPADPANPLFANLNSTVGAQYMWVDRLFLVEPNKANFMYQLVQTYRPGAMDTSLVSTDNINNPRTMNAVYSLKARLEMAKHIGHEELSGGEKNNKQFNEFVDVRISDPVLQEPRRGVDAARPEGRLRLGRRPGGAQPRLYQHRPLQRGVAAAFQRRGGRPADHADRDRDRAGELGLLARNRARARPRPPCSSSRPRSPTTWPTRRAARRT